MKPKYKWWTYINHLMHLELLDNKNEYEYILLGDSITEYWTTAGNKYWEKLKIDFFNAGVGGDKIENLYYRLNPNNLDNLSLLNKISVKGIVLMIGTNNIYNDDINDFIEKYEFLINFLLNYTNNIKIFGIIPILEHNPEIKINKINDKLKEICKEKNIEYHYYGNNLSEECYCDHEHLNKKGYKIWYKYIKENIIKKH